MKALIVYYSKSGTTKLIAQKLAENLDADLEELIETKPKKGFIDTIFLVVNALFKKPTPINNLKHQLTDYNLVIIGTPVWWWTMSTPIRTFLKKYKQNLKQVAFFATMGGGDNPHVFEDMEKLIGIAPKATLTLQEHKIKNKKYENELLEFVKKAKVS